MNTQQQLDALAKRIVDDGVTPGLAEQATQLVFGTGNPDADVLFIGEAPGKNEDLKGEPFVGAAGKFLNEMLESVDMSRDDIYITNIVKYRPPNNRDPEPEEKKVFWPYLLQQLAIITPKVVITLGRHSGQAFLPSLRISADHGQPKRLKVTFTPMEQVGGKQVEGTQGDDEKHSKRDTKSSARASQSATQQSATNLNSADSFAGREVEMVLVILPLYHPAAALYNGSLRQTLIDDFGIIPSLLN